MKTVLVVDDDIHISKMLDEALGRDGYIVLHAYSGTEALMVLEKTRPDIVLLDLMLPGTSGEEVLSHISGIPVIVLSAKADARSKVELLTGGAQDYVTKPFDLKELSARISLRIKESSLSPDSPISYDLITLDPLARAVSVSGAPVKLTRTEYAILKLLIKRPKQVFTKTQILDKISADTPDCTDSSLKIHISNLRKKLRDASGKDYIEAIWGIGFKLEADDKNKK